MQLRLIHILPCWLFCLLPFFLSAQLSFTTISDKQSIGLSDIVQVQFIAENASDIQSFEAPAFQDFTILQGPIETSGMSLVNGEVSKYQALTYILRPTRKGKLMIRGATALINGKRMTSNQLRIDVDDAKPSRPNPYPIDPGVSAYRRQVQEDYILHPNESPAEKIKKGLQVVLDLDKTTAYVGEPIVSTYKLLTRLRSDSRVSKRPSMNGFSVYDMVEADGAGPTIEEKDGKEFQAHIIRKTQLFPLQEGKFELEPVELENVVRFLRTDQAAGPSNRSSLQRLIDEMMGDAPGSWEEHKITLASPSRTITILPLPPGAPEGFSGAVGNFTLTANLSGNKMIAGETLSFIVEIKGAGNIPLINAPEWILPDGFTGFDPQVKEELNKTVSPMEGKKTFTYTITASEPGNFVLPGISFSFFNPVSKSYKSLQSDSIRISITGSPKRKTADLKAEPVEPVLSPGKLGIIAIGILVFILMIWLILKRKKTSRPAKYPVVEPTPQTREIIEIKLTAEDYLAPAISAAKEENAPAFYKALETAIWRCLGHCFSLAPSYWKKETILALLDQKGWSDTDQATLTAIWNKCEWARYAPGLETADATQLLQEAERIIHKIQAT